MISEFPNGRVSDVVMTVAHLANELVSEFFLLPLCHCPIDQDQRYSDAHQLRGEVGMKSNEAWNW